jgi:flagellar protein FlaG
MSALPQPRVQMDNAPEYRENYANSVQIRASLWDFFLIFGQVTQTAPDAVSIRNFQGIYVSPQQAKALLSFLQQHISQYESAFGEIRLEPQGPAGVIQ